MTRRIAIDATLVGSRVTGAGRVLTNLAKALPQVDPGTRYVVLATSEGAAALAGSGAEVEVVSFQGGLRWELRDRARAGERVGAAAMLTVRELVAGGGPPAVLHLFEPPSYRVGAARPRGLMEARRVAKDRVLATALRGSVRRAAAVTTGSQTMADWLRARYRVHAEVIHPGIDPVFLGETPARDSKIAYVLHSASGDPRDNTDLVLEAFARLRHREIRLAIVSSPAPLRPQLLARASSLGIADRLDIHGWISDDELRELYRSASLFLHPTKFESFAGLPALEAMALGTTVVALDAPGATEALEGVARLIPREDPDLLAVAIDALLDDSKAREELAVAGRERARGLTWEAAAEGFVRVFRRLLG